MRAYLETTRVLDFCVLMAMHGHISVSVLFVLFISVLFFNYTSGGSNAGCISAFIAIGAAIL